MHVSGRPVVALLALALAVSACGSETSSPDPSATQTPGSGFAALIEAAKEEGTLNTIALLDQWCNYREVIDAFKTTYGIAVNELDPNAGSNDELDAIKASRDGGSASAPDVVDLRLPFGVQAHQEGLLAPYKVSTWDAIPAAAKDSDGHWWGAYHGVLTFEVNTDVVTDVPRDWEDLLRPAYRGMIALAGDPRSSNQAIQSVYAAALARGGSLDDPQPGLEFFKDLADSGNLIPKIATPGTIATGVTPMSIRWNYSALPNRDALVGATPIEVVVPEHGRLATVYVQGISAHAPHPEAAKLWQEFLYSDAGQLFWLKGYCSPIRYADLLERGAIPQDLRDKSPDVSGALFPTVAQLDAATTLIQERWDAVVGLDIVP